MDSPTKFVTKSSLDESILHEATSTPNLAHASSPARQASPMDEHKDGDEKEQREEVLKLLDLNDRLRDLLKDEKDINLISIVAIGDQSHGKSSVLEAISGIELPRGEGIKTRMPLVMRLRRLPKGDLEEFAEIEEDGKQVRVELNQISEKIDEVTHKIAGNEKGISENEIKLTVHRRNYPDLTIIDLPGITRVAKKGQRENIGEQIKNMYLKYITPTEAIILNVADIRQDITNCESIKLSTGVDPDCERTILCYTHLDEINTKHLRTRILEGTKDIEHPIPLHHTFALRNRSSEQEEGGSKRMRINGAGSGNRNESTDSASASSAASSSPLSSGPTSLDSAREVEADFFRNHPQLSDMKDEIGLGVGKLVQFLEKIQAERLKGTISKLTDRFEVKISELAREQEQLGSTWESDDECRIAFSKILSELEKTLQAEVNGDSVVPFLPKFIRDAEGNDAHESLSAHIRDLSDQIRTQLMEFKTDSYIADDSQKGFGAKIRDEVSKHRGAKGLPGSIPTSIPLILINDLQKGIDAPILIYIEEAYKSLLKTSRKWIELHFSGTERLRKKFLDNIKECLDERKTWVVNEITKKLEIDRTVFEVGQNDFNGLVNQIKTPLKENSSNASGLLPDSLDGKIRQMQIDIYAYWKISINYLIDFVVKYVRYAFASENTVTKISENLNEKFNSDKTFSPIQLMAAAPQIEARRAKLKRSLARFKKSLEEIKRVSQN